MKRVVFFTSSPEETKELGRILGRHLNKGDVIGLNGELGAGKTCFVQGVAEGLGIPKEEYVRSPSFVIMNEYRGKISLYHLDFYRLEEGEVRDLHIEEYLGHRGIAIIEWAERGIGLLPPESLIVDFHIVDEGSRRIEFKGKGKWEKRLFSLKEEAERIKKEVC